MPSKDEDGRTIHEHECPCRLCCYIRARLSPTPIEVEWYDVVRSARCHGYDGIWDVGSDYNDSDHEGAVEAGGGSGVSVTTASGETKVEEVAGPITDDDLIDFAAEIRGWDGNTQ